jgi:hypothetical protein
MKKISKLVKELDKWFSLFVRLRDVDAFGNVTCFTCGKYSNYKVGMQCGHFQSRKHYSTRWNEKNCEVQCVSCNMFNQGEQFKFAIKIDQKHGEGTAMQLEQEARKTVKLMRSDYEVNISYYKQR